MMRSRFTSSALLAVLFSLLALVVSSSAAAQLSPAWQAIGRAVTSERAGDVPGAIAVLEAAWKEQPGEAVLPSRLGVYYGMAGRYRDAIRAHLAAERLSPGDPFNLAALGLAFYAAGSYADAAKVWERTRVADSVYWGRRTDLHPMYARALARAGTEPRRGSAAPH